MELGKLCQFILYGVEDFSNECLPYHDRLINGSNPIYDRLKGIYPNETDFNRATADLSLALTAYEAVYMEMGMKAGARLVYQLLHTDDYQQE